MNNNLLVEKIVFYLTISTACFLFLVYLNYSFLKSDFVLIGVFQELLTIPSIITQPIALILAIRGWYLAKFDVKTYSFVTIIISTVSTSLVFGSLV